MTRHTEVLCSPCYLSSRKKDNAPFTFSFQSGSQKFIYETSENITWNVLNNIYDDCHCNSTSSLGFMWTLSSIWVFSPGSETCYQGKLLVPLTRKGLCEWLYTHTHPDKVLSHRPINLTQRADGSESRSVMGYSPLETRRPTRALHQKLHFIVAAFLLSECFHSAFRYPLRYFCFWYSAFSCCCWLAA